MNTDAKRYAASLKQFHMALNSSKPPGFRFSMTYRVDSVPWFKAKGEIYEDWYVLTNFAAMDSLDKAVVHDEAMEAHRYLMTSAAGASGAIYYLTKGSARMDSLPAANWLLKPRSVSVAGLIASVKAQDANIQCSFWTRAMALGATEHCLLTSQAVDLPRSHRVARSERELFWSPSMKCDSDALTAS